MVVSHALIKKTRYTVSFMISENTTYISKLSSHTKSSIDIQFHITRRGVKPSNKNSFIPIVIIGFVTKIILKGMILYDLDKDNISLFFKEIYIPI